MVVASWPGCTLDSAAVPRFIEAATGPQAPRDEAGRLWFESMVAGQEVVERLTAPPLSLTRQEAVARLEGVLV